MAHLREQFVDRGESAKMFNFFAKNNIPRLPERANNIDKFSTYLMPDNRNGYMKIEWKSRPHLKRNLELYAAKDRQFARLCQEQDKARSIAYFWMDKAINELQPLLDWEPINRKILALEHLAAYFEQNCYQAAKAIWAKSRERTWDEYLSIARANVYQPDSLLKLIEKYEFSHGANIDTYIQQVLRKAIKSETDVGKFSNWRLLCKESDKKLKEALETAGHGKAQIACFLLARKYFKQVYLISKVKNPSRQSGQQWPHPDLGDFQSAANSYNAEKALPSARIPPTPETVSGEEIKKWMEICIKAIRNYPRSINPVSLEGLKEVGIEASVEEFSEIGEKIKLHNIWDNVNSESNDRELVDRTDTAFKTEIENIKMLVEKRIQSGKLQLYHRKIPLLYYGIGLTQTQIGTKFGINQANINRHLTNYYEVPLLEKLAEMSQSKSWVKPYVSGWLVKDFSSESRSNLIQAALVEAIAKLPPEYQEALQLRYAQNLNVQQISDRLCINSNEVSQRIDKAQQDLEATFLKVVDRWLEEYVKSWLNRFYKLPIYTGLDEALKNLAPEYRDILVSCYCQRRSEQQTAKLLNIDEKQFEEKIRLAKAQLQDNLLQWIRSNLDISLDKEAELVKVNILWQEWLSNLYKSNQGG